MFYKEKTVNLMHLERCFDFRDLTYIWIEENSPKKSIYPHVFLDLCAGTHTSWNELSTLGNNSNILTVSCLKLEYLWNIISYFPPFLFVKMIFVIPQG